MISNTRSLKLSDFRYNSNLNGILPKFLMILFWESGFLLIVEPRVSEMESKVSASGSLEYGKQDNVYFNLLVLGLYILLVRVRTYHL